MIILGIESATLQVGCALGGHEGVLASFHQARGRRHAETLHPAIAFVCEQAGIALGEVGAIAVDVGPGLFTGLRVGMATAKALATALRIPAVGVSSLDLLAFSVRHSGRLIAPAVDARRGEVYTALYRHVPGGVQRLTELRVCPATDLAAELMARHEDALAVGDGAIRYADVLTEVDHVEVGGVASAHPSADALVLLAHAKALREEFESPDKLEPIYLRKADAEANFKQRTPPSQSPRPSASLRSSAPTSERAWAAAPARGPSTRDPLPRRDRAPGEGR